MREDWIEIELGKICNINMGQSPPSSTYNDKGEGMPFFQGKAEFTELYPVVKKWCTAPKKTAKVNDILISVRAPVGATNKTNIDCAIGRGLAAITYPFGNNYLWFYLKFIERALDDQGTGTTFKAISGNILKSQKIPFAPLPEQKSLVSKIEQLFSELDNGIANLKSAKEKLEVYRQAVLKKAFEGELTKEWRKKQTELPSAEDLSNQITFGRNKLYENQIKEWQQDLVEWNSKRKQYKKPSKPKKLDVPEPPNSDHENKKWNIPKSWIWTQLGVIAFITKLAGFEYTKYVSYSENGDLPVIKAENAGLNGFKRTNYSKVKSEDVSFLKRSKLLGGELIIVFVGAGTGNVALVPKDQNYFLGPNIGMARPYLNVEPRFLELFFRSNFGKNLMMATAKAVAQPSLSMGTIRQSPVVFPSVREQRQIVSEIESRLSVSNKLAESINESLEKSEALRQSILKRAFSGELLTEKELEACKQDADWEPAEKLLERIHVGEKVKTKNLSNAE
ncbi:type I site-specific deoxyribonuclease [Marivirga tractuosa]|uniref:Restriction modification system DNA specificity domain n=1 Tax=Marivirga tractuosa (strain ATCC 23168 / DSM 4126 / NBRC 15989 / NCIMB 1408 / VKM B-1430 / H-43) TaxID=643867 RepID=E4TLA6_MARTH|nr:restriction endonuclease subunit S [Marivirga tractuosa]ADR20244.1 restriction modification system DNA specificity domain [Marivirga tractuosa DSM 4126]BDD15315.1 type I site-specific deoxyribonuclease [Marivirga tractuosa]